MPHQSNTCGYIAVLKRDQIKILLHFTNSNGITITGTNKGGCCNVVLD
jgi:hypothetical protein